MDRREDQGIDLRASITNESIIGRNERGLDTVVNDFAASEIVIRRRQSDNEGPCGRGCPDLSGPIVRVLKMRGGEWRDFP